MDISSFIRTKRVTEELKAFLADPSLPEKILRVLEKNFGGSFSTEGLLAGQSVASAIDELLGLSEGLQYSDLDIFMNRGSSTGLQLQVSDVPHLFHKEQFTEWVRAQHESSFDDYPSVENIPHLEELLRQWATEHRMSGVHFSGILSREVQKEQEHYFLFLQDIVDKGVLQQYDILGLKQEGSRQFILTNVQLNYEVQRYFDIHKDSSKLVAQATLSGFDLNNVQVGIDLSSMQLYYTSDYVEFLRSRELRILETFTPIQSFVRGLKKARGAAFFDRATNLTAIKHLLIAVEGEPLGLTLSGYSPLSLYQDLVAERESKGILNFNKRKFLQEFFEKPEKSTISSNDETKRKLGIWLHYRSQKCHHQKLTPRYSTMCRTDRITSLSEEEQEYLSEHFLITPVGQKVYSCVSVKNFDDFDNDLSFFGIGHAPSTLEREEFLVRKLVSTSLEREGISVNNKTWNIPYGPGISVSWWTSFMLGMHYKKSKHFKTRIDSLKSTWLELKKLHLPLVSPSLLVKRAGCSSELPAAGSPWLKVAWKDDGHANMHEVSELSIHLQDHFFQFNGFMTESIGKISEIGESAWVPLYKQFVFALQSKLDSELDSIVLTGKRVWENLNFNNSNVFPILERWHGTNMLNRCWHVWSKGMWTEHTWESTADPDMRNVIGKLGEFESIFGKTLNVALQTLAKGGSLKDMQWVVPAPVAEWPSADKWHHDFEKRLMTGQNDVHLLVTYFILCATSVAEQEILAELKSRHKQAMLLKETTLSFDTPEVLEAIQEWKAALEDIDPLTKVHVQVTELISALELSAEGNELNHCVGGYSDTVKSLRSFIIQYKLFLTTEKGLSIQRATAEWRPASNKFFSANEGESIKFTLAQIRGPHNSSPPAALKVLNEQLLNLSIPFKTAKSNILEDKLTMASSPD